MRFWQNLNGDKKLKTTQCYDILMTYIKLN